MLRADTPRKIQEAREIFARLSPRQQQVCGMVAKGMLTKQIAAELRCAVRTVEHHRKQISEHFGMEGNLVAHMTRIATLNDL